MRKYNPYLKNMVDNFRQLAKSQSIPTEAYSDEEIFAVIDFWSGMETGNLTEFAVLEDLRDGTKR